LAEAPSLSTATTFINGPASSSSAQHHHYRR
jgi:hypothetical protein